jgi:hypothetical protein
MKKVWWRVRIWNMRVWIARWRLKRLGQPLWD